jgi:polysaccharide chain length determinant protein (PEP-CTERM system associated)
MQNAEGKDSVSRLGEIAAQLDQAKLELREAEQALEASRQQIELEKSQAQSAASTESTRQDFAFAVETPEIDARINAQKRDLDGLLQRYTDQHPDVVAIRKLIRDLEAQKKTEIEELRKQAAANPAGALGGSSNILYQELNKLKANSEQQVAALRARVGEYASRYRQAIEQLKIAPQLEAEAAQLNRDYQINKQNYESLVTRRESAEISGDLDSTTGVADFRLIDPPLVSGKPVSPNRPVLLSLAMLAALAAGLATAFAASQLRPVFHSANELRAKFDQPLLGMVSLVTTPFDQRRARIDKFTFLLSSGGLFGVFLIAMIGISLFSATGG